MARQQLGGLIFASVLLAGVARAQDSSPAPDASPSGTAASATPHDKKKDRMDDARKIFDKLPPGARQNFRDNLERWKNMSPEEKAAMRDREQYRREKIAQEIDASVRETGLKLTPDQREVYALRYTQERRKIEEQLHKEMEEHRGPMLQQMQARLKAEFSAPSPSPSAK